jgi:hypothetical protein
MSPAAIAVRWSYSHRYLHVQLLLSRDANDLDVKRCRRIFAEALDVTFAQHGSTLETINFNDSKGWPSDEERLYNLDGYAEILRGNISSEQAATFGRAFLEGLNAVREYTAFYQRQLRRPK